MGWHVARCLLILFVLLGRVWSQNTAENSLQLHARRMQLLEYQGACRELKLGWWSYRWCHEGEITQFHEGEEGPVWSLGFYEGESIKEVHKRADEQGPEVALLYVHSFTGGQFCEETKAKRATEVHFYCCGAMVDPVLLSVVEQSTCVYVIRVCYPQPCSDPRAPTTRESVVASTSDATTSGTVAPPSVSEKPASTTSAVGLQGGSPARHKVEVLLEALQRKLLDSLPTANLDVFSSQKGGDIWAQLVDPKAKSGKSGKSCRGLTKNKGWWTFLWCQEKGVVQYHMHRSTESTTTTTTGTTTTTTTGTRASEEPQAALVEDSISLGVYSEWSWLTLRRGYTHIEGRAPGGQRGGGSGGGRETEYLGPQYLEAGMGLSGDTQVHAAAGTSVYVQNFDGGSACESRAEPAEGGRAQMTTRRSKVSFWCCPQLLRGANEHELLNSNSQVRHCNSSIAVYPAYAHR
jgi:hypothetical protein